MAINIAPSYAYALDHGRLAIISSFDHVGKREESLRESRILSSRIILVVVSFTERASDRVIWS